MKLVLMIIYMYIYVTKIKNCTVPNIIKVNSIENDIVFRKSKDRHPAQYGLGDSIITWPGTYK